MNDAPKVKTSLIVGAGGGALIIWGWNALVPSTPIPPEVAAFIAGVLGGITGPLLRKFEQWLAS